MRYLPLFVLACGACAVSSDASPSASPSASADEVARMSANALSPAELAGGLLTTATLDSAGAAAMATTADARSVLSYAVSCALDAGDSIAFSVAGTPYVLAGDMGVAPAWSTRALSASEAAWVSACVLARLNLTSTVVHISARGANAGYDTTIDELSDYGVEEGAFWGNVFTDVGAIGGFSCNGIDQAADDSYGDLPARACAQWDGVAGSNQSACGLTYVGLCTTACSTASPYAGCASGGGVRADAVVTSFLSGAAR